MSAATSGLVSVDGLPTIRADAETLGSASVSIRNAGGLIGSTTESIAWDWSLALPLVLAAPGAVDRLYSGMNAPSMAATALSTDTGGAATALDDFSSNVQDLKRRRDRIEEDILAFRVHAAAVVASTNEDLGADEDAVTWQDEGRLRTANADLEDRIAQLRRDWSAAREDCVDALQKLRNSDTKDGLFPGRIDLPASSYGFDFSTVAVSFDTTISNRQMELLDTLSSMSKSELERWRGRHPRQYEGFIDQPPDPAAVDRWWRGLGNDPHALSAVQVTLATGLPALIGNLQGVFSSARDKANRTYVKEYVRSEEDTDLDKTIVKLAQQMHLATGKQPPLQITTLDPRGVPRAALAVGDLDTADDVTYLVPGMNTWTAGRDAIPQWVNSATFLQVDQDLYDPSSVHAVVAWIGYDAPSLYTEPSVRQAGVGGSYLAGELDGLRSTRHGDPTLNVVGHSYGTTVSSVALQETHADRFVTLASAGLAVGQRSDIHVPRGEMYSAEARGDVIADWGRGPSEHRTKPTTQFGTKLFDVGPDGSLTGEGP